MTLIHGFLQTEQKGNEPTIDIVLEEEFDLIIEEKHNGFMCRENPAESFIFSSV